jgi:hypothetical protein
LHISTQQYSFINAAKQARSKHANIIEHTYTTYVCKARHVESCSP